MASPLIRGKSIFDRLFQNSYAPPLRRRRQTMARPKEFDPETAAQEAMEAFWERGYAATSVNDLLEEMGLNRGSLYGTFGDKKQLFLAALEKYAKCASGSAIRHSAPPSRASRWLLARGSTRRT